MQILNEPSHSNARAPWLRRCRDATVQFVRPGRLWQGLRGASLSACLPAYLRTTPPWGSREQQMPFDALLALPACALQTCSGHVAALPPARPAARTVSDVYHSLISAKALAVPHGHGHGLPHCALSRTRSSVLWVSLPRVDRQHLCAVWCELAGSMTYP